MTEVSVIIPVYNVEKYLAKCLDSVINQTLKDIEIICVNDGSTDSSSKILAEYAKKDERIKIINKENGGLSSARNKGLDVATGKYCYFLDSDDWLELDAFEKLIQIVSENNVDTVIHSAKLIPEDNSFVQTANDSQNWFNYYAKPRGIYEIPVEINDSIASTAWNKLYKMEIINQYNCRFPEGLINEDEAFLWTYMIHCKKYYYLNDKLYNYLKRSGSIMGTRDNSPKVLDILEIEKIIYNTVKEHKNIKDYQKYLTKLYVDNVKNLFSRMPKQYRKEALKRIKEYYQNTNHDKKVLKIYLKKKYKHFFQFIKGIFSISNIKKDHYIGKKVKILGIKIKFKNKRKTQMQEQNCEEAKEEKRTLIIKKFKNMNSALNISNKTKFKNAFLLFRYDYASIPKEWGVNLGDYVQTIATEYVINSIFKNIKYEYWDRDNLSNYKGKPLFSLMQGWFSHSSYYMPNEKILPIFIGTHITTPKRAEFYDFITCNPRYFKNITIGCRDTSTLKFMQSIGIDAYLSRCLTLTFPKRENKQSQNLVYIVDIPDDMLNYIPQYLRENAVYVHQRSVDADANAATYINPEKKYIKQTRELLQDYSDHAKLVITSALHCASPCIAMGIPTVLIDFEDNNDRFGSLSGIFHINSKEDLINGKINFNPKSIDIEDLKKLIIKNVELSIKQAFNENVDDKELKHVREKIENYVR